MSNQQDTKKKNPNVPNLRFSGFTEEWQIESADSLFEVIPNNTISRDGLSYESGTWKNIHYGDILTLFPTLLDVNDARVPYISSASFNSKTALSSGDVVIADTAEDYTAGKALEVTGAEDIKTVPGLHTIACHPTRTFASGFLGYYLNSYAYRERIKPFIQGIKVYSISKGNFLRSALSFPSIPEQAKIGCFLSLLDQRIEVQNKIIEELRSYKKSTFGLLTSQIYRFEKIAIGHLIEEYDERTIHSNEYPVLSSTSDGVYLQKDFFKKDHSSEDTTGYKKIPYGYCVYRSMSDTGRFYFNIQNRVPMGIVSPAYPVFRVREEAASYLTLFLNCDPKVINDLYKQKAGGTRFALPLSRIKRVAIPWPDEHFRKRVCDLFLAIERRLENESNLLRSFLLQKQFLLANMFI